MTSLQKLQNKIATRSLAQIVEDFKALDAKGFSEETAIVYREMIASVEDRFPREAAAAWKLIFIHEDETFGQCLARATA